MSRGPRQPLQRLIGKGCELAIYDPEVHLARLLGANKSFIAQHLPHIGQMLKAELAEVVSECEVLVVGSGSRAVLEALGSLVRPGQRLVDVVGARNAMPSAMEGLCW